MRALATDDEYEHAEAVVSDFVAGVGKDLQEVLVERASGSRSAYVLPSCEMLCYCWALYVRRPFKCIVDVDWLEEWWEEFIYLRPRWPIAIWINWQGKVYGW